MALIVSTDAVELHRWSGCGAGVLKFYCNIVKHSLSIKLARSAGRNLCHNTEGRHGN